MWTSHGSAEIMLYSIDLSAVLSVDNGDHAVRTFTPGAIIPGWNQMVKISQIQIPGISLFMK